MCIGSLKSVNHCEILVQRLQRLTVGVVDMWQLRAAVMGLALGGLLSTVYGVMTQPSTMLTYPRPHLYWGFEDAATKTQVRNSCPPANWHLAAVVLFGHRWAWAGCQGVILTI